MSPFLQLILILALLIASAKAAGYLSYRLGQPTVLGELFVGIFLGPSVINILNQPFITDQHLPEGIHQIAEFGVMLLMFLAGLELNPKDLVRSSKVSAMAGSLGVAVPLLFGVSLAYVTQIPMGQALFVGLILSATSVSISAQTLMELKVLRSRVGISMLGAAVFDDILVVLGLSIFTAFTAAGGSGDLSQVLSVLLHMVVFLLVGGLVGYWFIPRASEIISEKPISQGLLSFSLIIMLLYGWSAEIFGHMANITGAFLAGLLFTRSSVHEKIRRGVESVAYGLFVPIFFVDVGLKADLHQLIGPTLGLFILLSFMAVIGKILGAGVGARVAGFSGRESLQLGIGMMSRGEVGLIVATVGIAQGIITQAIFAAVVGVVILTTILTPPLLRWSYHQKKSVVPGALSDPSTNSGTLQAQAEEKGEIQ